MTSNKIWGKEVKDLSERLKAQEKSTVKPVYNDHPRDPKFVVVVDRWLLFRGRFMSYRPKLGLQNSGRCKQVVAIRFDCMNKTGFRPVS
jgi:hypothetical protein